MCEPRRAGSRGELRAKPSGRSSRSQSRIRYSVCATDFARTRSTPASSRRSTPGSTASKDRTGGVPTRKRWIPGPGLVVRRHVELVPATEPPPDRVRERLLEVPPHVEQGGRPGPAVHVLVRARDGEVDPGRAEPERHHADRVREVPEREGAGPMRERRHPLEVVDERRPVRGVGEGDQRGVPVDGAGERRLRHGEPVLGLRDRQAVSLAEQVDRALEDVEVRGEVQLVGDHGGAAGPRPERRDRQLEEVDGGGIRHDDVVRRRPDQGGELRADPLAGGEPALAPPSDEAASPLLLDGPTEPRGRLPREPPQRVAVQVDEARVADDELPPEARERIGRVQTARLREIGRALPRRPPPRVRSPRTRTAGGFTDEPWRRPRAPCAPLAVGRPPVATGRVRARPRRAGAGEAPSLRSRHRWPGSRRVSA